MTSVQHTTLASAGLSNIELFTAGSFAPVVGFAMRTPLNMLPTFRSMPFEDRGESEQQFKRRQIKDVCSQANGEMSKTLLCLPS